MYDAMSNEGSTNNPMTNDELFWKHMYICNICDQHPQSVASFHYEPMCPIGRSYAEALGYFSKPPDIAGHKIYVQDVAACSKELILKLKEINN